MRLGTDLKRLQEDESGDRLRTNVFYNKSLLQIASNFSYYKIYSFACFDFEDFSKFGSVCTMCKGGTIGRVV